MLVVGHEQQIVGDVTVGRVSPAIVVDRHGQHDRQSALDVRKLRNFGQEGSQILLRSGGNLLEVDGQSLKLVGLEKFNDVFDTRRSCRRVGK